MYAIKEPPARERAEADSARIVTEAENEAEKIRTAAKAASERESEVRKRELEVEIVDRAIERAEALLRERFSQGDQTRLVDTFIGQISNSGLTAQSGGKQ